MIPNFKKLLTILAVVVMFALLSTAVFAQTAGKIAGTVKDGSSQALPGANVLVVGTTIGGSTDSEGRYFILNVPPGVYSLRVTFLGYKTEIRENIRVSVGLTAEANFSLESSVIEGEEVVVVAERPLVQKTLTASVSNYTTSELVNAPVATFQELLETSPSVYRGFIRGGAKYETKTLVDGVDVTDSYFSQGQGAFGGEVGHSYQGMRPSDDKDNTGYTQSSGLVQELQVFAGTFNAEYPNATAGIINVVTKEGSPDYSFSLFNRTQASSGLDAKGRNIYSDSQGYFDEKAELEAGGFTRKASSYIWTPQKTLDDYNYDPKGENGKNLSRSHETNFTFSGPLTSKGGFFLNGSYSQRDAPLPFDRTKRIGASAKLHYNFAPGKKLTGMFQFTDGGELFNFVNWKYNPRYKYDMNGAPRYKDLNTIGYLKWSNTLSDKTFYEVQISHTKVLTESGYPDDDADGRPSIDDSGDFIDFDSLAEYMKYVGGNGDPNTENGYKFGTEVPVFFSATLNPSGMEAKVMQAQYDVDGQSVNGQYNTWYPIALYQKFDRSRINVKTDITSQVTYNHQVKAGLSFTRHTVDVNTLQSELGGRGIEYPTSKFHVNQWKFNPLEFAGYIQDRIEYEGLIVNIGARIDGFNNDTELFANEFAPLELVKNADGDFLRYEPLRGDAVGWEFFFSPRIGVSHPVTENLAMHYSFGRFFQYPNFASLYTDYNFQDYAASPTSPSVRPDQDPVRSTNYEIGAQWSPTNDLLINATAYYRDVKNTGNSSYTLTTSDNIGVYFRNTAGYSDARGIELELSKRPSKWWGGRISYAFTYIKQSISGGGATFNTSFSAAQDSANYARLPWEAFESFPTTERNVLVNSGGNVLSGGYDRPHRVNGTLQLFLPFDVNANLIGEWTSGFYYQRFENVDEDPFFGRRANLKVGPSSVFVNARLSKLINVSSLGLEVFFEARNLFNTTNVRGIANASTNAALEREIWELGRTDPADPTKRVTEAETDPEGVLKMPTDVFGRSFYLNAREFYVGVNLSIR